MLRGGGGEPERMLLDLGDTSPQIREESCPRSRSAYADTNWRDNRRHRAFRRRASETGRWRATRYKQGWTQGGDAIFDHHLFAVSFGRTLLVSF